MGFLVLPHRFAEEHPIPARSLADHAKFVQAAFVAGLTALGTRLAALSGLVGGSVLAYAIIAQNLAWPWAVVVALVALLAVFVITAPQRRIRLPPSRTWTTRRRLAIRSPESRATAFGRRGSRTFRK
jgi:MFS family permease